ncbi:discoidin domain-containing protein [Arcticibacter sp. MXS-1]|uniref:discoidin domain-containing protein n=1 Tax=Arcticibacter sp. MXS-1 TaxID=3341726 RepID=UPI0035A8CDD3
MYSAINDQYEPADSKDTNYPYLHWWPAKNSTEYVQYDFPEEKTISKSEVYWFDDGPWGGCRIPAGYKLYYKQGENWLPVKNTSPYSVEKDKVNRVTFEPVKTTAIKLELQLPQDNSSGIHEWAVE